MEKSKGYKLRPSTYKEQCFDYEAECEDDNDTDDPEYIPPIKKEKTLVPSILEG